MYVQYHDQLYDSIGRDKMSALTEDVNHISMPGIYPFYGAAILVFPRHGKNRMVPFYE